MAKYLRPIYTAVNPSKPAARLDEFAELWGLLHDLVTT